MRFAIRRHDRRLAAYQLELLRSGYAEIEDMYQQMRTWRHNYRSHIQTMKAHVAAGELDALSKYLDELDQELKSINSPIRTGNPMTDAILRSKLSLARAKGIPCVVDADIPLRLSISELDLCCILGNLFDNAMEASLALPPDKRMIRVYMAMKGAQLYISFTNLTAARKQRKTEQLFPSTHGENRGLGMKTIARVVNQLGGYFNSNSEDGAFTAEILLPQNNMNNSSL